jgi:aspartyl protease family protein
MAAQMYFFHLQNDLHHMSSSARIGAFMYILASILVLVLMTILFGDALKRQRNPNQAPESINISDGGKSIILRRNPAGHYVFNGTINGTSAEFILDTGATAVSIPASFADRIGLEKGPQLRAITANGITRAYATRIDSLAVGDIEERNVEASIVPNLPDGQILLGMSFLKRLDFFQRDDTLILTQPDDRSLKLER